MATTTAEAFNEFHDRVYPTTAIWNRVKQRQKAVEDTLQAAFPPGGDLVYRNSWLVGSLGRDTASVPVDDIDLLTHIHVRHELWESKYARDSSEFLYRVRKILNGESNVKKVGARGQAVRLFYADGLWVDVAAVEKYNTGAYAIPDGKGNWITTDPLEHAAYLKRCDDALEGDLRRFIRIVKQWNKAHSSRLTSFHVEALAARTFTSLDNNRREALKIFFEYNTNSVSVNDPAGHGGDLSSYLTATNRLATYFSMAAARDRAREALKAENKGNHKEAIRLWKIVLGDRFPVYV